MGELVAPVIDGMPLVPYPYNLGAIVDLSRHHPWYRQQARELTEDAAGEMLRICQVVKTERQEHVAVHDECPDGVASFPQTVSDKVDILLPLCGKFVARYAFDVTDVETPIWMSDEVYGIMRRRTHLERTQNRAGIYTDAPNKIRIGNFLTDFVLAYGLDDASSVNLDKFKIAHGNNRERRGKILIEDAIENAIQPFEKRYGKYLDEGLLDGMYSSATELVKRWYVPHSWRDLQASLRGEAAMPEGVTRLLGPAELLVG
jgi:hypothetical protein